MSTTSSLKSFSSANNIYEGWNYGFSKLVGHFHPTTWKVLESIPKDQAQVAAAMLQDEQGLPPSKRVRQHSVKLQTRLQKLCTDHEDGICSLSEIIKHIGHCFRWK